MWIKRVFAYGVVAAVAVLLASQWVAAVKQANQAQGNACFGLDPVALDRPAGKLVLPDLAGRQHSLQSLRGKVVLLHFWFTQCPPCIEELPSLYRLRRGMSSNPSFALLTVSVDEEKEEVKRFLARHRLTDLPVLWDPDKKSSNALGTSKFPESYLIDRAGKVRFRFINKRDWSSPLARQCIRSVM
jgi:peroxiredoxin